MTDVRGGNVRFSKLRRDYVEDGAFDLVEDGDLWLPERSYAIEEAGDHVQASDGVTVVSFTVLRVLATRQRYEVAEDVETSLVRQEAGLEQTRPTVNDGAVEP